MPLCSIHLLALHSTTPNPILTFLSSLKSSKLNPLVISRVVRWIILPTTISTESLLARNIHWDLYLVLPDTAPLPTHLSNLIQHHWTITAGVPSRLVENFSSKNTKLLHPDHSSVPKLVNASPASKGAAETPTKASSQNLELSAGLEQWIQETTKAGGSEIQGAVSMFNLLAFKPDMKSEYLKYGAAFAKSIGSRHGGNAKIVGNVVAPKASQQEATHSVTAAGSGLGNESLFDASADGWDEIALAHYPSILHFRDMLLSKDYQEVNHRHRVPSLRDTCILMTSELGIEEMMKTGYEAKL